MSDKTGIEWTDATWNPTTGCDRVSPGCDHCYAMTLAPRLKAMGSPRYQTDGDPKTSGPGFGIAMHPDALDQPLRWTRPRRIFVNSMSDLFHAGVTDDFIARVFAVMALAPQHTFQLLTKRHGRMRALLSSGPFTDAIESAVMDFAFGEGPVAFQGRLAAERVDAALAAAKDRTYANQPMAPLPNVWLGVSVEDQKRADLRIAALLDTPAAVRFLSCEPLLGPVDVINTIGDSWLTGLHWIIVGGESGRSARPMHPEWARSLRDQAEVGGAAFHFKQWGEWAPRGVDDDAVGRPDVYLNDEGLPTHYARRHDPHVEHLVRVGKKAAGRELDGRTWDEFPTTAAVKR